MPREREVSTLVMGGSGFLGAHLVAAALARERGPDAGAVVSASREPGAGPAAAGAELAAVDALAPGSVERMLDERAPARVLLATALGRIDECRAYPGLARALNVELPARVARWCAGRARLVLISTDLVFGAGAARASGWREDDPPAPVNVYGETKADGERAVLAADPLACVARLPLLYGDSHGRARGASDALLAGIARGGAPTLYRDEWRTPLDVRNAADAVVELARLDVRGVLHLAGPQRLSRLELGLLVLEAAGFDPARARASVHAATRAEAGVERERPVDSALDASRARALLATRLLAPAEALRRAS